jgi:hypothetical protein
LDPSRDLDNNATNSQYFVTAFDWDKYASLETPVDSIFNWNKQNKRPSRFGNPCKGNNAEICAVFYRYPLPQQTVRLIAREQRWTLC